MCVCVCLHAMEHDDGKLSVFFNSFVDVQRHLMQLLRNRREQESNYGA